MVHESSTNNKYVYHLSDDNTHDFAFTDKVAKDVIDRYRGDLHQVIRFKSDKVQYSINLKSDKVQYSINLTKCLDSGET